MSLGKHEEKRGLRQFERTQKRELMVEGNKLGRSFELTTSDKIYVNDSNLYEIKNEIYKIIQVILQ